MDPTTNDGAWRLLILVLVALVQFRLGILHERRRQEDLMKKRYCAPCDEWLPAKVGPECPKCGSALSKPVVVDEDQS
jgi:uncharacterized paraquat-inducible protein A